MALDQEGAESSPRLGEALRATAALGSEAPQKTSQTATSPSSLLAVAEGEPLLLQLLHVNS